MVEGINNIKGARFPEKEALRRRWPEKLKTNPSRFVEGSGGDQGKKDLEVDRDGERYEQRGMMRSGPSGTERGERRGNQKCVCVRIFFLFEFIY